MQSSLKCTHCGTRMTAVENRGVTIDWCEFCHSLWFDPAELVVALTNGQHRPREPDPFERTLPKRGQTGLSCPRCRPRLMEAVGWEGLGFSQCPQCHGLFIDRPQLLELRDRFAGESELPTSGQIAAALSQSSQGLAHWAELLWTVARMVGRLKLGGPAA